MIVIQPGQMVKGIIKVGQRRPNGYLLELKYMDLIKILDSEVNRKRFLQWLTKIVLPSMERIDA